MLPRNRYYGISGTSSIERVKVEWVVNKLLFQNNRAIIARKPVTMKDRTLNNDNEYRVKHLEFIEDVINRQAKNSFTVKGWSLTLSAGIFTYLLSQDTSRQVHPAAYFIVILPAIVFWLLDAYYLRQERVFRCLYDDVRQDIGEEKIDTPKIELFNMDTSGYKATKPYWRGALWGKTVWLIPAMIILASAVLYFISNRP